MDKTVMAIVVALGWTTGFAHAAEPAGDVAALLGTHAEIGSSAYLYRADCKPGENPPETEFLFSNIMHTRKGLMCGLLWEEPRPISHVELTWAKDAGLVPRPEDVVVRWMPHGSSASWWGRHSLSPRTVEKPVVSGAGRTYTFVLNALTPNMAADNLVVALKDGSVETVETYAVPTVRVFTSEPWKMVDVEIEWGFQKGTEDLDFGGRIEAYNGVVGKITPLSKGRGAKMVSDRTWTSEKAGRARRGISLRLLYLGSTQNTTVWPHHAVLEDANRTIVTVKTRSGSFSFMPADLETGPILAPEYGFFVRATNMRRKELVSNGKSEVPLPEQMLGTKLDAIAGNGMVRGWGSNATPWWGANATDEPVLVANEITVPAHRVAAHPGGDRDVAVAWRSPIEGTVDISGKVADAQSIGGDGINWCLERESKDGRHVLAAGAIDRGGSQSIPPVADAAKARQVEVEQGDLVSLVIGARGSLACDSTLVDLVITEINGKTREWDLARDVADSILEGNPHADQLGNPTVWYFHTLQRSPSQSPSKPVVMESKATTAREFVRELAAKDLKTIRQRVREHEEQTWEGAMKALFGDVTFPPYPKPDFEPSAKIDVPEMRLADAWRVGAWHILRGCEKDKDGHYIIEDYPYSNCGLETPMMIHTLDLMGMHSAASDGLNRWITQLGAPSGEFSDGDGCFKDAWSISETPWSTQWALLKHYLLTGDKEWLSEWSPRIEKNAGWIVRQRRGYRKDLSGRKLLWMYGLLPPSNIWDAMVLRPWYTIDANSCFALRLYAEVIVDIDPALSEKYQVEAEAYAGDILAAVEKSLVRSPVIRVRDGTYHSFIPPAPYMRGPSSRYMPTHFGGPGHTPGLYADVIRGSVHFINFSGLLTSDEPRAQGLMDVMEDRLLLEHHRLPVRTPGYDPEKHWFGGAGWYYQCGIERTPDIHLQWDDVPNFLRSFFNHYAVDILPGNGYTFREHTTGGPPDKSFEEAVFLERLRNMLVWEQGDALWLAKATPRAWLAHGKRIATENMPTHFGTVGYEIISDVDNGKINATVAVPSRRAAGTVLLRLRHPNSAPIKRVTVNGRHWSDFDKDKEIIRLRGVKGTVKVRAEY